MEPWIHVAPSRGTGKATVEITVDANETNYTRTGTVSVEASTLNKELIITQKGLENMTFFGIKIRFNALGTIEVYIEGEPKTSEDGTTLEAATRVLNLFRASTAPTSNASVFMLVHDTTNNKVYYCPQTYIHDTTYSSATLKLEDNISMEISRTEGISISRS